MKVLLLQPTYYEDAKRKKKYISVPPLGLAYLASITKKLNHKVKIFDVLGRENKLHGIVSAFQPDVIGITCMTTNYLDFLQLCSSLRNDMNYKGLLVAGGAHITLEPEKTMRQVDIDVAFIGEAEETFRDFLIAVENKDDFKTIKGLYIKNIGFTGHKDILHNLDDCPMPAYDELEMNKYVATNNTIFVECSRGCPYNCIYCSSKFIYGQSLRLVTPEKVVNNIQHLRDVYGFKEFSPLADTFVCNPKWLEMFCKILNERKLGMLYRCNGRINLMNDKVFNLLKGSGCKQIDYGIESAVGKVLKNINKAIKEEQIDAVMTKTYGYGFKSHLYFMISLPGENEDDIDTTIQFARKMRKKYNCSTDFQITRIYPGTPLAEKAKLHIDDWAEIREPSLPYPNVPAYYELDKELIFNKWQDACLNAKELSFMENIIHTIPELYKTSRSKKRFFSQILIEGNRKILRKILG